MRLLRVLACALPLLPLGARASNQEVGRQVVELTVTSQAYEPARPWAKATPRARTALGAVVEGNLVLTTAQMVGDATLIQVGKNGGAKRSTGRVARVDSEVNLALVAVDEPGFFDDLKPVRLARKPVTEGAVNSARWRNGQLEVSTSRVARAEVRVSHSGDLEHAFLLVKSDLAGGGWSEPVFLARDLVGLTVAQDEDLAYVLPASLLSAFLRTGDRATGYPGFGGLGLTWQANRDPSLSAFLGLRGEPRGVVVLSTAWGGSACGVLRRRDVLLSLDGHEIDAEGYYVHPQYGRIRFTNIVVDAHLAGDILPAQVLRDGAVRDVSLRLRRYPAAARLIPGWRSDYAPPYVVAGGLVFRQLDLNYLTAWGKEWRRDADARLVALWDKDQEGQRPGRRRIVVLAYVLPSAYTIGYQGLSGVAVRAVNGRAIGSLADLAEALRYPQGGFQTVTLEPNGSWDEVVLDASGLEQETGAILESYGIPAASRLESTPLPDPGEFCSNE